jgi:hypothetical protein
LLHQELDVREGGGASPTLIWNDHCQQVFFQFFFIGLFPVSFGAGYFDDESV